MTEIGLSGAQARLADIIDEALVSQGPVYLTSQGRRVVAVIAADQFDQLVEAAEDLADIRAAAASRAESAERGSSPIRWTTVKADLGLE